MGNCEVDACGSTLLHASVFLIIGKHSHQLRVGVRGGGGGGGFGCLKKEEGQEGGRVTA